MSIDELVAASGLDARDEGTAGDDMVYLSQLERTIGLFAGVFSRLDATATLVAGSTLDTLWATPQSIVAAARSALERDVIRIDDLSAGYRHMTPEGLVDALQQGAERVSARATAPVLSHGDATLRTLRLDGAAVLGFADWQRAAISDRHRDLAVAARYLLNTTGPGTIPTFVSQLEHDPDPIVLDWYLLAVELIR